MRKTVVVVLVLHLACATPLMCEPQRSLKTSGSGGNTFDVAPDNLGPLVMSRDIELMTLDGTYIKGKVLRTSPEEIVLRVKKSEPKGRISGREVSLRSADIAVVNMRKAGGPAWPVTLGVLGGLFGGGAILGRTDGETAYDASVTAIILGAMAAGATAGVILGKRLARKTVVINVNGGRTEPRPSQSTDAIKKDFSTTGNLVYWP